MASSRTFLAVVLLAALSGCAGLNSFPLFNTTQQVTDFHPFAMNADGSLPPLKDTPGYQSDDKQCTAIVLTNKPKFDVAGVVASGVHGAASNASNYPISPYTIPAGAAGEATSTALGDLQITANNPKFSKALCMDYLGVKVRGTYHIIDAIMKGTSS